MVPGSDTAVHPHTMENMAGVRRYPLARDHAVDQRVVSTVSDMDATWKKGGNSNSIWIRRSRTDTAAERLLTLRQDTYARIYGAVASRLRFRPVSVRDACSPPTPILRTAEMVADTETVEAVMKKLCSGWGTGAMTVPDITILRDLGLDIACGTGCGARTGRGTSYSSLRHERIVLPSGFGCDRKEELQYYSAIREFQCRKCPTKYYGSSGWDKM